MFAVVLLALYKSAKSTTANWQCKNKKYNLR